VRWDFEVSGAGFLPLAAGFTNWNGGNRGVSNPQSLDSCGRLRLLVSPPVDFDFSTFLGSTNLGALSVTAPVFLNIRMRIYWHENFGQLGTAFLGILVY
jgi:hypothetical protein